MGPGQLDALARSLRRSQWLVEELDHNRRPAAVEQAVAGLRLELFAQLHSVQAALEALHGEMPPPIEEPHSALPPQPDGLF